MLNDRLSDSDTFFKKWKIRNEKVENCQPKLDPFYQETAQKTLIFLTLHYLLAICWTDQKKKATFSKQCFHIYRYFSDTFGCLNMTRLFTFFTQLLLIQFTNFLSHHKEQTENDKDSQKSSPIHRFFSKDFRTSFSTKNQSFLFSYELSSKPTFLVKVTHWRTFQIYQKLFQTI